MCAISVRALGRAPLRPPSPPRGFGAAGPRRSPLGGFGGAGRSQLRAFGGAARSRLRAFGGAGRSQARGFGPPSPLRGFGAANPPRSPLRWFRRRQRRSQLRAFGGAGRSPGTWLWPAFATARLRRGKPAAFAAGWLRWGQAAPNSVADPAADQACCAPVAARPARQRSVVGFFSRRSAFAASRLRRGRPLLAIESLLSPVLIAAPSSRL